MSAALGSLGACTAPDPLSPAPLMAAAPKLPPDGEFGPEQRSQARLTVQFEVGNLGGCDYTFTQEGAREYSAIRPALNESGVYDMDFIGRTRVAGPMSAGYGHLNTLRCQIEVTHVLAVRPVL